MSEDRNKIKFLKMRQQRDALEIEAVNLRATVARQARELLLIKQDRELVIESRVRERTQAMQLDIDVMGRQNATAQKMLGRYRQLANFLATPATIPWWPGADTEARGQDLVELEPSWHEFAEYMRDGSIT